MIVDLLLNPDKALDAVNKAVALVKKVSKTIDNVESLGPVLGKYFDAKANAIAVAQKAKAGGFGASSMGKAIELEMAIEAQREFEEQLKMLFFQSNKMDVWQKIKARAALMEVEAAKSAAADKRRASDKKKKDQENLEAVAAVVILVTAVTAVGWFGYQFIEHCAKTQCG